MSPTTLQLIAGARFPYVTLVYKRPAVRAFLDHWWENADITQLSRPYTLADSDPNLEPTVGKQWVDTTSYSWTFSKALRNVLSSGKIAEGSRLSRATFREEVVRVLADHCPQASENDPAIVIFTGGGYGAGKTSSLQFLVTEGKLPQSVQLSCLQGVDYCKQLLPEFNRVKAVGDGRASEICQDESRLISNMLFGRLIEERRSFGWDSSMSNRDDSLAKIEAAKAAGYRIGLIAVQTDVEVAIQRAMTRAKLVQRFAHPNFLEGSHRLFRQNFEDYWALADSGFLIENSRDEALGGPILLRQKPEPTDT